MPKGKKENKSLQTLFGGKQTQVAVGVSVGLNTAPYRTIEAPLKLESTRTRALVMAAATRAWAVVVVERSGAGASIAGGGGGRAAIMRKTI